MQTILGVVREICAVRLQQHAAVICFAKGLVLAVTRPFLIPDKPHPSASPTEQFYTCQVCRSSRPRHRSSISRTSCAHVKVQTERGIRHEGLVFGRGMSNARPAGADPAPDPEPQINGQKRIGRFTYLLRGTVEGDVIRSQLFVEKPNVRRAGGCSGLLNRVDVSLSLELVRNAFLLLLLVALSPVRMDKLVIGVWGSSRMDLCT